MLNNISNRTGENMEKRKLGKQGLTVYEMGLGCMGMSEFYGTADDKESIKTIHRALDLGINFIDTADMYGPYKNEELVCKAIKDRRDKIVLATKFGIVRTPDPKFRSINGRPEYVKSSCDGSLKRLGTDHIDLYYQHRVDPDVPIEDTVGAMSDLVKAGKVRYLGLSEAGVNTIRRAHKVFPISAIQTEYSLWTRDPEPEILPALRDLGIGFVAYSPLGRGFLTGRFNSPDAFDEKDFRQYSPRFRIENFNKNLKLVEIIKNMADKKEVTPGQLALAWVLSKGKDIVPIPGTTKVKHLEENVAAMKIRITESEQKELEEAIPLNAAAGARYPETAMNTLSR
jgi:aryl-alcohol dehydrogenase-like predicted oxidoreductase